MTDKVASSSHTGNSSPQLEHLPKAYGMRYSPFKATTFGSECWFFVCVPDGSATRSKDLEVHSKLNGALDVATIHPDATLLHE